VWNELSDFGATFGELRTKYFEIFGQPSRSNWRLHPLVYGSCPNRPAKIRPRPKDYVSGMSLPRLVGHGGPREQPTDMAT
jgi:hypothetical protein